MMAILLTARFLGPNHSRQFIPNNASQRHDRRISEQVIRDRFNLFRHVDLVVGALQKTTDRLRRITSVLLLRSSFLSYRRIAFRANPEW